MMISDGVLLDVIMCIGWRKYLQSFLKTVIERQTNNIWEFGRTTELDLKICSDVIHAQSGNRDV